MVRPLNTMKKINTVKVHVSSENLPEITSKKHIKEVYEVNNKQLRMFRPLNTMKKINTAKVHVSSFVNKLWAVTEGLAQKYHS